MKEVFLRCVVASVLWAATCVPSAAIPPGYTITDVGFLGKGWGHEFGINEAGQVVSKAYFEHGQEHAFVWADSNGNGRTDPGEMRDCGTLGGVQSHASGVNNSGQVVGGSNIPGELAARAFLWENGAMINLGTLGGPESDARRINDSGQVVGMSQTSISNFHAFLWADSNRNGLSDPGEMKDLGAPLGYNESRAGCINNSGQVGVYARLDEGPWRAFLWTDGNGNGQSDPGEMQDLGALGGASSTPRGINDSGQVVGLATTGTGGQVHAFLWEHGFMTDLGTLGGRDSYGWDINELGQAVGWAHTPTEQHAFVWENGTMTDLNGLLPSGSGWVLQEAAGINDSGQITGMGVYDGQGNHAFLLTPVPEPSSLLALVCGLSGLGGALARRRR